MTQKTTYEMLREAELQNATFKKLEKICSDNDYKLFAAYKDSGRIYITIRSKCDIERTKSLQPEILYYYDRKTNSGEFKISQWGIGTCTVEELKQIIKGNEQALNIITEANKLDLTTLYEYPEEE